MQKRIEPGALRADYEALGLRSIQGAFVADSELHHASELGGVTCACGLGVQWVKAGSPNERLDFDLSEAAQEWANCEYGSDYAAGFQAGFDDADLVGGDEPISANDAAFKLGHADGRACWAAVADLAGGAA